MRDYESKAQFIILMNNRKDYEKQGKEHICQCIRYSLYDPYQ